MVLEKFTQMVCLHYLYIVFYFSFKAFSILGILAF